MDLRRSIAALAAVAVLSGCGVDSRSEPVEPGSPLDRRLDAAYRIDIRETDVTYRVNTRKRRIRARAEIYFSMRPGQTRPLFDFAPAGTGQARRAVDSIELDGEALDPRDHHDVRLIRRYHSPERAFELRREIEDEDEHVILVRWRTRMGGAGYGSPGVRSWIANRIDDTSKTGNVAAWPALNTPGELSRYRIELRIRSPQRYILLGSGQTSGHQEGPVQVLKLDAGREVWTSAVMMVALPRHGLRVRHFEAAGIPVTLVSALGPKATERAVARTGRVLRRLASDFGEPSFPSLDILLTNWNTGMEFYAGTATGPGALPHELAHLYWGASAIGRTWRDTWWDEALATWWDRTRSRRQHVRPVGRDFRSDIVSGRGLLEPSFDTRGYGRGSRMIAALARRVGGNQRLIELLEGIYREYAFRPMTTRRFANELAAAAEDPWIRRAFGRWVFDRQR